MTQPRILVWDCETSPIEAHTWGLWDQNVGLSQIMAPTRVICYGAKWHGTNKVIFRSEHHDGKEKMIADMWDLWNEADAFVHFNGSRFDVPHLKREFLLAGMTPPKPVQEIDLLKVIKQFSLPSYKLAYISDVLDIGAKVSHEGHRLWVKCLEGDEAAWKRMRRYCIGDVKLTEVLYDRIRPWIKNHPHMGLFSGDDCCANCGGTKLVKRGFKHTALATYQQYRCDDCGKWSVGAKSVERVGARGIA